MTLRELCRVGKENEKIGMVGYGISNRAVLRRLTEAGVEGITVYSDKTPEEPLPRGATLAHGAPDGERVLVLSPSVRRDTPALRAAAAGCIFTSDAELFFAERPGNVYAVTGSDGKSTTVTLTTLLLSRHFATVEAVGNIGIPFAQVRTRDDTAAFAAELSSFQLMYMHPTVRRAAVTSLTENHLNWHRDMAEYIAAKRHLPEGTEECVFGVDTPLSAQMAREMHPFAVTSVTLPEGELRSFHAALTLSLSGGTIRENGKALLDTREVRMQGSAGIANLMTAYALCAGRATQEDLYRVATTFGGLPHRMEYVGEAAGCRYYNSSADTSPARTAATLGGLHGRASVILGGRGKNLSYAPLGPVLADRAETVVLCGENAPQIAAALAACPEFVRAGIPVRYAADPGEALRLATAGAGYSGTVILSPASTAFDAFRDFTDRGDRFRRAVRELSEKAENAKIQRKFR